LEQLVLQVYPVQQVYEDRLVQPVCKVQPGFKVLQVLQAHKAQLVLQELVQPELQELVQPVCKVQPEHLAQRV
jgi:hypothetical protein